MSEYRVYDRQMPSSWQESIPVGNGKMGASLMAGITEETIYLNEETIWSTQFKEPPNPPMAERLHKIRQLFLDGKPAEGDKLAKELFGRNFPRIRSYESAGILKIGLHENDACSNYSHSLDLMDGVATVEYDKKASHYKRTCFASYPDNVIVYRVESSKDPLDAWIAFERENILSSGSADGELFATCQVVFGGYRFCVKARVLTDGKVSCENGAILVSETKAFTVLISIATSFRFGDNFEACATFPEDCTYEQLEMRHIADFSALMNRADIQIPLCQELEKLPLNQRRRVRSYNRVPDDGLIPLQWQFGRYLLVSSSRPGSLPANLQGIWAQGLGQAWSCDYHTNINLQANYWGAEVSNLSQCHLPLFDYMNNYLLESGKKTAKIGYGSRGCVVHHLSDIYQFTTAADGLWGIWPHGASWLSYHMWEHYLFTKDEAFLKEQAYPFMREAAIFFCCNLVEDKDGYLVYGPSTSPENRYWVTDENGEKYACYLTMSSAMDIGILTGLFRNVLAASDILGIEDEDMDAVRKALKRMPPFKVAKDGRLQEWMEDYEESEKGHYHLSPTFAMFPGCVINRSTPEFYEAVGKTVTGRMSGGVNKRGHGAVTIGWSIGWLMALLSRLRRGDEAYKLAGSFPSSYVFSNLWDKTVGGGIFQIDGNLAYVGGLCEMLIQSHEDVIALIPAIPKQWAQGSFRGLRVRGGAEIDVQWENREVRKICLKPDSKGIFLLELPATQKTLTFRDQKGKGYTASDLKFTVCAEEALELTAE